MYFSINNNIYMWNKIPYAYYHTEDVVWLAQDLLGKVLCVQGEQWYCEAIITETEAYSGRNDKACHSNENKCTPRTRIMYAYGWHAYVYLCYGIHILFNIVTNQQWSADAILIRAVHPITGLDIIQDRIGSVWKETYKINGPGKVSKALGITLEDYGCDLTRDRIWLEDHSIIVHHEDVIIWPRVGIDYAWEDAFLPWRFQLLSYL